jgi:HEAT repeat protein
MIREVKPSMTAATTLTALAILLAADNNRPALNPLAPSLPILTREQEERIENAIDRFIDYESGKLSPAESARAVADFKALGMEATLPLISGLNRAANIQSSCPAVVIARKLSLIFSATEDVDLLEFGRENVGAGVTARRHLAALQDLRLTCMLRKSALQRRALAGRGPGQKTPQLMSIKELAAAADSDSGPRRKAVLVELEQRPGEQVIAVLSKLAASDDDEVKQLARTLLGQHVARLSPGWLQAKLQAEQGEVRAAAARAAGSRIMPWGAELIELLNDREAVVRQAAKQALVQLARGQDFGPTTDGSETERAESVRQWRTWWDTQKKR